MGSLLPALHDRRDKGPLKPTDDDEVTDGYIVVERYARDERFLALFLVILILAFVVKVSS